MILSLGEKKSISHQIVLTFQNCGAKQFLASRTMWDQISAQNHISFLFLFRSTICSTTSMKLVFSWWVMSLWQSCLQKNIFLWDPTRFMFCTNIFLLLITHCMQLWLIFQFFMKYVLHVRQARFFHISWEKARYIYLCKFEKLLFYNEHSSPLGIL